MKGGETEVWCADFETTSVSNLEIDGRVRVWLWSAVRVRDGLTMWGKTIEEFFDILPTIEKVYFHNLKFDGKFIVYHLAE